MTSNSSGFSTLFATFSFLHCVYGSFVPRTGSFSGGSDHRTYISFDRSLISIFLYVYEFYD